MPLETRILELEKKNAVLEYQVQEQREILKSLKTGFDTFEKMLIQIKENPLGLKS